MNTQKIAALLTISFLILSCSTAEKQARQKLDKMGIGYSESEFLDSIAKGKMDIVTLFLEAGMSPNTKQGEITALMEAARRGKTHSGIAAALIKAGAEITARDSHGVTPLMFAAISGSPETIRMLLKSGADVKAKDADGRTVLIESLTTENGSPPEIVEELIQAGAEVNVKVYGGLTPLMIAAGGDSRVLRTLIHAGADLNATDDQGATALRWAKESPANYQILKDAGAKE